MKFINRTIDWDFFNPLLQFIHTHNVIIYVHTTLFFCRHSYGEQFSKSKWMKEMVGQRELLSAFAGIPLEDIRGMRAPFLAVRAPFKGRSRYIVSMVLSNSFSVRIEVGMYLCSTGHYLPDTCFSQNWGQKYLSGSKRKNNMYSYIQSKQGCHKGEFEKILSQIIGAGLKNDMSIIYFFFNTEKYPKKDLIICLNASLDSGCGAIDFYFWFCWLSQYHCPVMNIKIFL